MSTTVNDLIKLLDTQENRYGGATGKPRELNISINGNFCGYVESAKLDGHGDGLATDVTLEFVAPKAKEYYEQEIRTKAIDKFAKALTNKIVVKYCRADLTSQYVGMQTCDWIKEIAEKLKEAVL